jgi:hypothetical protein
MDVCVLSMPRCYVNLVPLRSIELESTRAAAYQATTLEPELGGKR